VELHFSALFVFAIEKILHQVASFAREVSWIDQVKGDGWLAKGFSLVWRLMLFLNQPSLPFIISIWAYCEAHYSTILIILTLVTIAIFWWKMRTTRGSPAYSSLV